MNLESVVEICAQHGLPLRRATVREGVLLLTPQRMEDLPSAEALRALAHTLRTDEVRWVTLDVEEPG